ncbi:GNAT family N-acetyltransferase [Enterococcus sp. AZ163]|uniref:GNAT family N-acetyltransferase n=1 Tax=Enterococcus sp. AZ163 TaxID=2774638 RepID=UPI003D280051
MNKKSYHFYAMASILCWSISYVLSRFIMGEFSAYSISFLRYIVASIALILLAPIIKLKKVEKQDLGWIFLTGAVGFFIYMIAFNKGLETVNAATGSVIIAAVPMISSVLSSFIYKEKLTKLQWFASSLSFMGVLLITLLPGGFTINYGLIWFFVAAFCMSFYNLLSKRLVKKYAAIQVTTYSIFAGTILLSIFSVSSFQQVQQASWLAILCIVLMGVFSSAVAYVCWAKAFERADNVASVSNYMYLTPFFTSILGFLLIDEVPGWSTVIGGLFILGGLVLFNSKLAKKSERVQFKQLTKQDTAEAAEVIRRSFATVAEEFQLTRDNCPTNGAFTQTNHLLDDLKLGKNLYGVFYQNTMIGFFQLENTQNQEYSLEKVAILPKYRHQGYGSMIMQQVKTLIKERGGKSIKIGIIEENTRLKKWYEEHGFVHLETKTFTNLPFEVGFMKLDID